jgi:hypothetical protein
MACLHFWRLPPARAGQNHQYQTRPRRTAWLPWKIPRRMDTYDTFSAMFTRHVVLLIALFSVMRFVLYIFSLLIGKVQWNVKIFVALRNRPVEYTEWVKRNRFCVKFENVWNILHWRYVSDIRIAPWVQNMLVLKLINIISIWPIAREIHTFIE